MENKELFDKANSDKDLKLQSKLRNDFADWCKKNARPYLNSSSLDDWMNEEVIGNIHDNPELLEGD